MSWLIEDWRLKLLALLLAVVMLGAVAFAQAPTATRTFHPVVNYTVPSTLVILNPQLTVAATVTGLADTVNAMTDQSLIATLDASKAAPGQAVKLNIGIRSLVNPVTVQNPAVPIALNIDTRATDELQVQVITHPVAGWSVTKAVALCGSTTTPCVVHFDGPQSWEKTANLAASVDFPVPVNATNITSGNWPIQLRNANGAIDPLACNTRPVCGLDVTTVTVSVEAQPGTTSTTVPINVAAPTQGPPPGYQITGITISPATVVITGAPTALAKIQRIVLPGVDLSKSTTTATFNINITVPDGVTILGSSTIATVIYTIQRNPAVTPSP